LAITIERARRAGASIGDAVQRVEPRAGRLDDDAFDPALARCAAQLHRDHVHEVARPRCCAIRSPRAALAGEPRAR
jgi:hypothetical protein